MRLALSTEFAVEIPGEILTLCWMSKILRLEVEFTSLVLSDVQSNSVSA
jgi:hypothetical protein